MKNKVAIITGGASGIGLSSTDLFYKNNWDIIVLDINKEAVLHIQNTYDAHRVCSYLVDITNKKAIEEVIVDIKKKFKKIDAVINSAGIGKDISFENSIEDDFTAMFKVNILGSVFLSQEIIKMMKEAKQGSIVNIASVSGIQGNLGRSAYGVTKGGIISLTKVMAVELAPWNIRVNAIAPGPIQTPLVDSMHSSEVRNHWINRVPLKRYADPIEVAEPILFLSDCSKSSYITGQTINVDGGFTIAGLI